MSFRFKSTRRQLSAAELGALRKVCELSIAEIKRRAAADLALLDVLVFSGEWPNSKSRVVALLAAIEHGELPLRPLLLEHTSALPPIEEELSVSQAREWLQHYRDIALEQDMHQQLELGYINSPAEYEPPPEDEA